MRRVADGQQDKVQPQPRPGVDAHVADSDRGSQALALQRTVGNRATARLLGRWIELRGGQPFENDRPPRGYWPLGGYWVQFNASRWGTDPGYRARLEGSRSGPPATGQRPVGFHGDIRRTNDIQDTQGCSNCVAADYLRMKLSAFQARFNESCTGRDGPAADAFFKRIGIHTALDVFADLDEMMTKLGDDFTHYATGALAWGGHVVRWSIRPGPGEFMLWDPQGNLGDWALVPSDKQLFLMTFISAQGHLEEDDFYDPSQPSTES